jgi:hypothetical protein
VGTNVNAAEPVLSPEEERRNRFRSLRKA